METENLCQICDKAFSNKYTLKSHLKTHEDRERSFECNCGKRFLTDKHLRNHQDIVHSTSEKSFACTTCFKKFKSLNNLQTHRAIHEEKAFLCRYCDKTFARTQDVRIHEKVHRKVKDFKCTACEKSFTQQSNLIVHIKTVHYQIKTHSCKLCNKSYKRKRLLDYHLLSVHGDTSAAKKLNCDECDFATIYPSHLKKHLNGHYDHQFETGKLKINSIEIEKCSTTE